MNVRWACCLPMCTFIAILAIVARTEAQAIPPVGALGTGPVYSPESPVMGGYSAGGMSYPSGPMGQSMDTGAYAGNPYAGGGMPPQGAMMGGDPNAAYGCDPASAEGGYGGYAGEQCGPARSCCRDIFGLIGPYADGGCGAPRYFDLSIEAMWLQRDNTGHNQPITSNGISGPIVLSTNSLNFEERPGFRINAWLQFRANGNVEFVYYGQFHSHDSVQVNSPNNNLYSAFSNFGTLPPGGFLEDGGASYNRIEYSSVFDNFEVNYRRHWQGANSRFQGSYLAGIRYFKLDEDFDYISVSALNAAQLRSHVNVNNSLTGGQIGGDLWVCIIPGLRAGVEAKAGVFGNHSQQSTRITATTLPVPYTEDVRGDSVAFVSDGGLFTTYRVSQQFNLKVGYNLLYASGVSLASQNFNTTPPQVFIQGSGRTPRLDDNGFVFYHGASVGVEYNW